MIYFYYCLAAIISGVVAGMGMGGGTLLIPILTIFFSVPQQMAQGINLLAFLPTAIVALIIHCKNRLVSFKKAIPIITMGIITSIIGSFLATSIKGITLQKMFGYFILTIGVFQIIATIINIVKRKKQVKIKRCIKYYAKRCNNNIKP